MRSRYSAYALRDEAYVLRTWHPASRPRVLELGDEPTWLRLSILDRTGGSLFDGEGTVRFEAHYREAGRVGVMRENSHFVREAGSWFYTGPR